MCDALLNEPEAQLEEGRDGRVMQPPISAGQADGKVHGEGGFIPAMGRIHSRR